MAGNISVEGMNEISKMLTELGDKAQSVASLGLYDGAGVMAKALFESAKKIKTAPFKYAKNGEQRLPSPEEKDVVLQADFGISKFDKSGAEVSTSVGFNDAGYANVSWAHMRAEARTNYKAVSMKGHEYNSASLLKALGKGKGAQNAKPIGAVLNGINSGTSFMKKQPFVRKGEKAGKGPAEQAIIKRVEEEFDKITKKT